MKIYLIRHAETEWTLNGRHTGTTDLPLTPNGRKEAALFKQTLNCEHFTAVLCSPLKRAFETCEIAGLSQKAELDPDLVEWNYGKYEGLTTSQIWQTTPNWNIFSHGAPEGESLEAIDLRVGRVLKKVQALQGNIALFSHGHFLRALTVRFLKLPLKEGSHFTLSPCSLSILGFERAEPALLLWNHQP